MPNPTRIEVCCDKECPNFNVEQVIELTDAEVAELAVQAAEAEARKAEEEEEALARATAKADLLEKLGITEDEAKLLLS